MTNNDLVIVDEKNKKIYLSYKEKTLEVKLVFRKRKNISIKITPKDNIEIISPKSVSLSYLKKVLIIKINWIMKNLNKLENIENCFIERKYDENDKIFYLGRELSLKIIFDENINVNKKHKFIVNIDGDTMSIITSNNDKEFIKENLKQWYKMESEKIVEERIQYLKNINPIMEKLNPTFVKIKEQKKRWGSCTSSKKIYINSKISMAKLEVIDYIIIHEFSHLIHMNHSKEFYKLVENIMYNYNESEKWLKENSYKLVL